jgi:hypothetical protein
MTNADRDALEATQLRIEKLERELAEARERNEKLEAELAGGDTADRLATARRLTAAIQRAQVERLQRQQAAREELAARERAMCELAERRWHLEATRSGRVIAALIAGFLPAAGAVAALAYGETGVAVAALIVLAGVLALIGCIPRDEPPTDNRP